MKRKFEYWFSLTQLLEKVMSSGNLTYEQIGKVIGKVKPIRNDEEFTAKEERLKELTEKSKESKDDEKEKIVNQAKELFDEELEIDVTKFKEADVKDMKMSPNQYLQIKAFIKD